jgi:hypothetical protein
MYAQLCRRLSKVHSLTYIEVQTLEKEEELIKKFGKRNKSCDEKEG